MLHLTRLPSCTLSMGRITQAMLLVVSLALCSAAASGAQSGRRRMEPPSPISSPATDAAKEGESESQPKSSTAKRTDAALVTFIVMEDDNIIVSIPYGAREAVFDGFLRRLKDSRAVSVESAGRGGRGQARDRAKKEKDAFVVLLQLEEDAADSGRASIGGSADTRTLVIKTYVYAPATGDLKFTDRVWQRPVRQSATIGGVRLPVPVSRQNRYPSELQLEQAARDAADRVMSRFNVIPPTEN
ncbi:MAG: hypothetical protein WCD76_17160 [Pyrinomonadaceae bacterium]